jgi:hypothetical protein
MQKRWGCYCSMTPTKVTGDPLFPFVQQVHGHLTRPLLVSWDRFSGHKKAARVLQEVDSRRLQVEYLPAYAPELTVVDHAWGHTKDGAMAHGIPRDLDDLSLEVAESLRAKHHRPDLLKACFAHARLDL